MHDGQGGAPQKASSTIQDVLFYSQIAFAMNAARIIKAIALLNEKPISETGFQVLHAVNTAMIINSAKIWDKSHFSLERFVKRKGILEAERVKLMEDVEELRRKHQKAITDVFKWRNELVAHLSKAMTSEDFKQYEGDIAEIQSMLKDVAELVARASWYPADKIPMKFLDYATIQNELRV